MVRYSSRVGAAGNATVKKRGAPKKVGILVKKGSDIAIRGGMSVGGQVEESDLKYVRRIDYSKSMFLKLLPFLPKKYLIGSSIYHLKKKGEEE